MSDSSVVVANDHVDWIADRSGAWTRTYVHQVAIADFTAAVVAARAAVGVRFGGHIIGGYEMRFLDNGSDEFRRALNAGVSLASVLVLISYSVNNELSRVHLAISMAIRLSDRGPALFTQIRVGKDGRPFKIYKFRTMVVDAEARLAELRLVVKPGLTGMWQVNGRSDLSWEESVRLDLRQVENWSLALDRQLLWKTVAALFKGSGAY